MSADHQVNSDMRELAELLARENAGQMTIALHELLAALKPARPVRVAASDDFACNYLNSVPTDKPYSVVGRQLDRERVTLTNVGATGVIWIGRDSNFAAGGAAAYPLRVGSSLTLTTKAPIYVLADAAGAELAWIIEEFDA